MISTRQIQKWIDSPHQSLHNAALVEAVAAFVAMAFQVMDVPRAIFFYCVRVVLVWRLLCGVPHRALPSCEL